MRHAVPVWLAAIALFAVLSARAAAAPPSKLVQIEQTTAQIRHLSPLRPVAAAFLPGKQFDTVVQANLRQGETDTDITLSQRELVLLGLLSPKDDYRKILFDNLTSQVLGLYDYVAKKLYVRKGTSNVYGIDRYDIAHEYTHALQDQHYNLQRLMPNLDNVVYRNSDAENAHHALIEGDAVNTQYLYIFKAYSPQEIHDLVNEPVPHVQPLPAAVQREFDFPYTTGLQFVQQLYRSGGMTAVDAAYRRLPNSTYEIMHPSAYLHHWKARAVMLHSVHGFPDWKQTDDDVNGAFGIQLILWQHLDRNTSVRVVTSYLGDRYVFLENGSQDAMVIKTVWADHKAAVAAKSAWAKSLRARFSSSHLTATGGATVVQAPSTSVYLRVTGTALKVVYAPTSALAQSMGTAQTD